MWFIGVEVVQETSAPSPKKNPGSAPVPKTPSHFRCVVVFSGFLSLLSFVDWDFTLSLPLKHFSFHNVKLYIGCMECISIYLLNFFVIKTFQIAILNSLKGFPRSVCEKHDMSNWIRNK